MSTDAFMISSPQALREYVFTGRESSTAISQLPFRLSAHDWIVITGQSGGRQVQLAIMKEEGLQDIWQALAGTGAALVLAAHRSASAVRLRAAVSSSATG